MSLPATSSSATSLPGLDHLVIDVADLDAAAATLRGLGFQLTARGQHSLGSANHLAMFGTNYLELLTPGTGARPELADFADGMNGLVFATPDADARYADLLTRGIAVRPPQSFSRPVTLGDGTHDAKFRTTHLMRTEVPFGRLYFCQHDTRDLVWRAEWQVHPNGAADITGITISADDPAAVTGLFTRMFDRIGPAGAVAIDILRHADAAARLGPALPDAAGRPTFLAAVQLRTTSLATTAARLGAAATATAPGTLLIPAAKACNVAIAFME